MTGFVAPCLLHAHSTTQQVSPCGTASVCTSEHSRSSIRNSTCIASAKSCARRITCSSSTHCMHGCALQLAMRENAHHHSDALLAENRQLARDALSVLGDDAVLGEAAIYLFARLPPQLQDDTEVVRRLIQEHRVTCIPGSACGVPGHIRVAFANLSTNECKTACERLRAGLQQLMDSA